MATEIPDAVKAFSKFLAEIKDPKERDRALRKATMLAVQAAPEENLEAEPLIRTLADYLAADIKVPPVLVHPYMCVRGGVNVTVGRAGKGKTVMNMNRMLRWSAGLPQFDTWTDADGNHIMRPDMPLKILVVENEGAAGMFHRQIGLMTHAEGFLDDEARELAKKNFWVWKEGGYSNLKLDDEAKLKELRNEIERWEPDLVFIEPFRSLWNGEENSATEMTVVVDALANIAADFDCGVWAAHHAKKGGGSEDDKMSDARGSTVLEGIVTVMENFESTKLPDGEEGREISWSKSRYQPAPNPVVVSWNPEAWWYSHVPASDVADALMTVLRENNDEVLSTTQLSELTGMANRKLTPILKDMAKEGKIKQYASESGHGGSTGLRWRLLTEDSTTGGLGI